MFWLEGVISHHRHVRAELASERQARAHRFLAVTNESRTKKAQAPKVARQIFVGGSCWRSTWIQHASRTSQLVYKLLDILMSEYSVRGNGFECLERARELIAKM